MSNVHDLWSVQAGQESTRGTGVDPTAKLMGVTSFSHTPTREVVMHEERRGSLQPGFNASLVRVAAEGSLGMDVSYEDVLYVLQALFSEVATPTGADPYTWGYAAPNGAAPTPQPFTIIDSDGDGGEFGYGLEGALVSELTFSFGSNAPVTLTASLLGTDIAADAPAALSDRSVNFVLGHHLALYMDDADGTIGTTQLSNVIWNAELTITPNRANKFGPGSQSPIGWRDTKWGGSLRTMIELTNGAAPASEALIAEILGTSPVEKQIRIKAADGTRVFQADFAGVVNEAPELFGEEEGTQSVDINWMPKYNAQLGNWLAIEVQNALSSLT